jgi:hypothetical protein
VNILGAADSPKEKHTKNGNTLREKEEPQKKPLSSSSLNMKKGVPQDKTTIVDILTIKVQKKIG